MENKDLKMERQKFQMHKDGYNSVVEAIKSIPSPTVEIPEQKETDLTPIIESNSKEAELTRKTIESSMKFDELIDSTKNSNDNIVQSLHNIKTSVDDIKIPEVKIPEFKFPKISFDVVIKPLTNIFTLIKDGFTKVLSRGTKDDPIYVVQVDENGKIVTEKEAQSIIRGGGFVKSVNLQNVHGDEINPATEESINTNAEIQNESLLQLRRIVKLLESNAVVDINNRQKITLDSVTVGTVATGVALAGLSSGAGVPTPNMVTGAAPAQQAGTMNWQQVWIGPVDQRYQIMDNARMVYDAGIRNKLAFT